MENGETLLKKIKEAKYFTVLANESMDTSGIKQMSMCVSATSVRGKKTPR